MGSKCLVMQTMGNYLGLRPSEETSERMFQVATQTFNLLFVSLLCILISLTSLASIYSQTPVLFSSVLKSTSFTPTPFLSLSSQFRTLLFLLKLGPLGATRAQHIS
jgi:hypothetical protein